jgi:hypothetical protein
MYRLETCLWVPLNCSDVSTLFSVASNLEALMPSSLCGYTWTNRNALGAAD